MKNCFYALLLLLVSCSEPIPQERLYDYLKADIDENISLTKANKELLLKEAALKTAWHSINLVKGSENRYIFHTHELTKAIHALNLLTDKGPITSHDFVLDKAFVAPFLEKEFYVYKNEISAAELMDFTKELGSNISQELSPEDIRNQLNTNYARIIRPLCIQQEEQHPERSDELIAVYSYITVLFVQTIREQD